jgi:hypothetical protein
VQEHQQAHEQDAVADAEHVAQRLGSRYGNDVAQPAQVGVGEMSRILKARADRHARESLRRCRRRHDPSVGDYRRGVERATERDGQRAGHAPVGPEKERAKPIGANVDCGVQGPVTSGEHRDDRHLYSQGHRRGPPVFQVDLAEPP